MASPQETVPILADHSPDATMHKTSQRNMKTKVIPLHFPLSVLANAPKLISQLLSFYLCCDALSRGNSPHAVNLFIPPPQVFRAICVCVENTISYQRFICTCHRHKRERRFARRLPRSFVCVCSVLSPAVFFSISDTSNLKNKLFLLL